jgi:hypothetical protein
MGNSVKRARVALIVATAAVLVSVITLPTTALARAATRIVTAKTITVHSETQGTTGWPVTITASLQKWNGRRYVAASGTVRLYLWTTDRGWEWVRVGSRYGSSVSFSISDRGKYKLVFSGSTRS